MKLFSKILPVALCGALLLAAVGCGGEKYQPYDYEVKHASGDNVLRFYSSVASLIRCASPPDSSVDG